MLRNIKYTLAALVLLLGASSCLEKYPQTAIPEREAMKSFSDAEQIVSGIYTSLKSSSLNSGLLTLLPDIQCDLVHAVQGNTNTFGNFWRWDIRSTSNEVIAVYASLYGVIGSCNFYLDQVDAVRKTLTSDEQFDDLEIYTGEVYFLRAFAYSELIKCYCKAYPATDAEAQGMLGVVLATSYFNPPAPRRASLYDSYQLVISDLEKAAELLDVEDDAPNNVFASAAAVQALQARTALYMQKWQDAVDYSTLLINRSKNDVFELADAKVNTNLAHPLVPGRAMNNYDMMWATDESTEIIWRMGFTVTSYGPALGSVFFNFTKDYNYFYPDYIPSDTAWGLYSSTDLRLRAFFSEQPLGYSHLGSGVVLLKYFGNLNFLSSQLFQVTMPKMFRLSEQYLIRAEANCRLKNFTAANNDIRNLRTKRFTSGGGVNLDDKNWLDEISNERVRELFMEGFRLQDLKRWGRGFERKSQQGAQPEAANLKIEKDNPLFVWPIPQHELEAPGSEIQPNDSNK